MGATTNKFFDSQLKEVGNFGEDIDFSKIKNEPMFFNCDFEFALKNGGPITKSFIHSLPEDWKNEALVFDSRVHMLMAGWYPAIPGYHHDDVPRPVGSTNGQPDYDNPSYKSKHILGLLNADVCPTSFAVGQCEMPAIEDGQLIYRSWHKEVEKLIENGKLEKISAKNGVLYEFDWQTFHTGEKAKSNGWRWFGRVSKDTDRLKNITNEIRVNCQVYLEFPMEGW